MKKVTVNLIGNNIGSLTVLRYYGHGGSKRNTEWLCRCLCGEEVVKSRSFLTSPTRMNKTCGNCIDGKRIISNVFKTFKIIGIAANTRAGIVSGLYIGECINCSYKKKISKFMIRDMNYEGKKRRNLTCPNCLVVSRRGGGLKIGDQNNYLRIIFPIGTRGNSTFAKYYWKVECLFKGGTCKQFVEYSSVEFKRNISCGCKWAQDRRLIDGMSRKNHPYYKIYQLRKNIYDRCHIKTHKNYPAYGGRGIYMYELWRLASGEKSRKNLYSFLEWCLNNGWQEGLQLDRIDNNGPYSPENCQFIPSIENLFYAAIDNASEMTLRIYYRYFQVWEYALQLLVEKNEVITQEFEFTVSRWKNRIDRRASQLQINLGVFNKENLK